MKWKNYQLYLQNFLILSFAVLVMKVFFIIEEPAWGLASLGELVFVKWCFLRIVICKESLASSYDPESKL